jgi:beta-mannanase
MVWAPNIVAGGISPYASVLPDDMSTIDIVGLDFYHFNSSSTDLSIDPSEVDNAIGSIYSLVQQIGKPFIMTETGVSYFDDSGTWATATDAEVAEKQTWLGLLTSSALITKYPQYGGFFWFDYNKYESSEYRDFSISQQSLEAMMFSSWVAQNRSSLSLGQ